jgi:hypothetical protein
MISIWVQTSFNLSVIESMLRESPRLSLISSYGPPRCLPDRSTSGQADLSAIRIDLNQFCPSRGNGTAFPVPNRRVHLFTQKRSTSGEGVSPSIFTPDGTFRGRRTASAASNTAIVGFSLQTPMWISKCDRCPSRCQPQRPVNFERPSILKDDRASGREGSQTDAHCWHGIAELFEKFLFDRMARIAFRVRDWM